MADFLQASTRICFNNFVFASDIRQPFKVVIQGFNDAVRSRNPADLIPLFQLDDNDVSMIAAVITGNHKIDTHASLRNIILDGNSHIVWNRIIIEHMSHIP